MKTKFYLSLVAMLFAALTASAEDFMYNGLAYNLSLTTPKYAEVTKPSGGYTSLGGAVNIPSTVYYNGSSYAVRTIGKQAFQSCTAITSVTIPTSVETICQYAFDNCSSLETINFAANGALETIQSRAFSYTAVKSVTIPDGVVEISSAFWYCPELTTLHLPDGLLYFSGCMECSKLTTVNIPSGMTDIGGLGGCTSLKTITIPNTVTRIVANAFENSGLTSITIPNSVKQIGHSAFRDCRNLTTITIPSSVTDIGSISGHDMFNGCTGLTSATILNNIITQCEFLGCTSLKTVTIGNNIQYFGSSDRAFEGCPIEMLNIGSNLAAKIIGYPDAKTTLKTLNLTDGVTEVPESAFEGCSVLEKVTLPSGLKSIGNAAFRNCTRMGDLYAKMVKPFAIDASVFSGVQQHGYCDLHVPQGSKVRYSAMEVWKEFTIITEDAGSGAKRGDVNNDGQVTIADVVAVLNIMAGN